MLITISILLVGFLSRIIIHTPNFSPVLSLALFGGVYLKGRQPIWVPLALMAGTDLILGFHNTMVYTWGSILLISMIGIYLKDKRSWMNIISVSLFSSVLFFVVTNFGAFLTMYPHTWAGLSQCYTLAIPFYRSTLVSTLGFSLVLFSIGEFVIAPRHSILPKENAV